MRIVSLKFSCLLLIAVCHAQPPEGTMSPASHTFHVDPDGDEGVFHDVASAQAAVREVLPAEGPVEVVLHPGAYPLSAGLAFGVQDSGRPGAPVRYRAAEPGTVRFQGGRRLDGAEPVQDPDIRRRLPESARDHVLQIDLKAAGIDDWGRIVNSGFARPEPLSHMELFCNGDAMRLAEWPNNAWTQVRSVPDGKPVIGSNGKRRGTAADRIGYSGDRPGRWAGNEGIWMHGYWFVEWADMYLKVADIDKDERMVRIAPPQSGYGYKKGQRFRFLNVLEELDRPGEWVLDADAGMAYVWPTVPREEARFVGSVLAEPLITCRDASHISFIGCVIEAGRGDGVRINGGEQVRLLGCEVRNLGGTAVHVSGGRGHRIQGCDVHHLGGAGIILGGGDRQTLTPGEHEAVNNHVHHYSRWVRTYQLGIRLSGVGLRAAHNAIHDAPHAGISYGGNNHRIEYNDITRICLDTGDVGAIYTGRDWTARGTVIRHNYIHHLGGVHNNSNAVYLDDLASGQTIVGNIFHQVNRGMMIGGGRDNVVENNVFYAYRIGIHFDKRGLGWSGKLIRKAQGSWDMFGRLKQVPYDRGAYAEQYPALPTLLEQDPLAPKGNRIARNIFVGKGKWLNPVRTSLDEMRENGWCELEHNLRTQDAGFVDPENGDFRLRPEAEAADIPFEPIPVDRIGLYTDEFRVELP